MTSSNTALFVHFHFPTGKGNRVRVLVDGRPAGGLDCRLEVTPGEHAVAVTSWGLPLCGPTPITGRPGASVELELKISSGLWVGMIAWIVAMAIGVVAILLTARSHHPGPVLLLAPAMLALAIAACILIFHVVLPSFSVYTCRLAAKAEPDPR